MNLDEFITFCSSKKGVTETMPFGGDTLVFKVMDKMFALCGLDNSPLTANLKCSPDRALILREEHEDIIPGYHMNKKHWNTVVLEGNLDESLLKELIDHSYTLVVKGLPKNIRAQLDSIE